MSNRLDRLIGYFWPNREAARARARRTTRIYEGADRGRRGASWTGGGGTSANAELSVALTILRDRSRELSQNNPWASRMLDILSSHTVGNGIVAVSNTGSDKIDNQVNSLWGEFCEQADARGLLSFYAMQDLAVRSMVQSGDVVVRFIDSEMRDDQAVPLKLLLLEADVIDHFREGIFAVGYKDSGQAPGVVRNRLGVGLGEFDEWRGLWLWPRHPGEQMTLAEINYTSQFMSRDDLVHMFKHDRPGQVRGVPWFAPILQTARDTDDIKDAANVKARVEACFAGFITNTDESMPLMEDNGASAMSGSLVSTLEPGMLKELRSGQDIKFAAPTSTSQLETILLMNLQAMAAGMGCTYDQATGDLRQANYSSLRAGKIEFWRLVGKLQQHVIIPQLCKPVWNRFVKNAVLAGRLPDRKKRGGYPVRWVVPAKEMIDPKKDFDATKNLVRSGAMTPQDFIASFGGDWRTSLEAYKAFFEMAKTQGVVLDIDVSQVDQHGRKPTAKGDGQSPEEGDPVLDDVPKKPDEDDDPEDA